MQPIPPGRQVLRIRDMPTIHLQAEVSRDALLGAVEQLSPAELDQFVAEVLELRARRGPSRPAESGDSAPEPPLPLTGDAWHAELEAWKRDAEGRAGRYPSGFVLDDSREILYREREDAQL
jgi:hypothetical protein